MVFPYDNCLALSARGEIINQLGSSRLSGWPAEQSVWAPAVVAVGLLWEKTNNIGRRRVAAKDANFKVLELFGPR